MIDYTPNSHKYKEEQKAAASEERTKLDKVVTGTVQTKKKSAISKFSDVFIAKDAKSVGEFIVKDVIIPNVANLLEDIVIKGIRMFLRGESGPSNTSSVGGSYVSYNLYSNNQNNSSNQSRTLSGYDYKDVVLRDRRDAEIVLMRMREAIAEYGSVSVADMYDLLGETCNYTDNKYGWTNLSNAEPVRVRDGYLLKLPKALPL